MELFAILYVLMMGVCGFNLAAHSVRGTRLRASLYSTPNPESYTIRT